MRTLERITRDPETMGGKSCIRGMRVTVGTVVALVAVGRTNAEILAVCPFLEEDDIGGSKRLSLHEMRMNTEIQAQLGPP